MNSLFDRAMSAMPYGQRLDLERMARTRPDPVTRRNANRKADRQSELVVDEVIAEGNEWAQRLFMEQGRGHGGAGWSR